MKSIVVKKVSFVVSPGYSGHGFPLMLNTGLSSRAFFLFLTLFLSVKVFAQTPDSVQQHLLDEVQITTQHTPSQLHTATPTQVIQAERLEKMGAIQLSDAVRQLTGVTLKDYGGIGGIKTVSARGLGSQFSAVTIDGIPIDNAQNGQVDLGRYTLGNSAFISLSHGQEESALHTARALAAGNVLNMESALPSLPYGRRHTLKAGFEGGSFALLSPTLKWDSQWSQCWRSSLYLNLLRSDGDYPFTLYYTASHSDSSSVEHRDHSAVSMLTASGNIYYTHADGNTLMIKVHHARGHHQLPGPVHFYSQQPSHENTTEEMTFVQSRWRIEQEYWRFQLVGKVQSSYDTYEDSSYASATHYLFNEYRQRTAYLSTTYGHDLWQGADFTVAADGDLGRLLSNLAVRNDVLRNQLTAAVTLRQLLPLGRHTLELRSHLLLNAVRDRVADLDTTPTYRRLSPFLSARLSLGHNTDLRLFYKNSYRVPCFGELYFFQSLPRQLRPEHARQVNLGVTHSHTLGTATLAATADIYYNRVADKIVARPGHNMYYWSMENLGRVDILGVDATADFQFSTFNFQLNYSYQHAVDYSNPDSKVYGHQIVYTPRHSGNATLRYEHRWLNLGLTAMVVGERYCLPQNKEENRLAPYCDLGLSADRSFALRHGTLGLSARLLNLLDQQYEVVKSYPMMGRNWRIGITYEF